MGFIPNDEQGIADKNVYACIARVFKKGLFAPKRIDEEAARACTELTLVSDDITNLDFLSFFPNLEDLDITSANLANILGLRYVQNLDWLALYDHALTDISPVEYCPKLTSLQVNRKQGQAAGGAPGIGGLAALGRLGQLEILSLQGNGIVDISWITGLQALKTLDLSDNPVTDFSPLLEPPNLKEVYLDASRRQYTDGLHAHLAIEYDM